MPVHPRVCGEQPACGQICIHLIGSSPRVRGTVERQAGQQKTGRFIPACAGNSRTSADSANKKTVHPRVCGEQSFPPVIPHHKDGSSPRVRGTVDVPFSPFRFNRFIPACAGNRKTESNPTLCIAVHPRVCGEQALLIVAANGATGSSPRVRGTGNDIRHLRRPARFIPACAGNRGGRRPAPPAAAVHPRVCGEQ